MYIHVKVKAGQRIESVKKIKSDHFEIAVREKAERGAANSRVLEILRLIFGKQDVRLISGRSSPGKLFSIRE